MNFTSPPCLLLIRSLLVLGALFHVESCYNPGNPPSVEEKEKIKRDVTKMLQDYVEAVRKDGLTAELNYLDESTDFFWNPPGYKSSITYDSVATILRGVAPGYSSVDNRWDSLTVVPLHHGIATYTGKLHSVMTDTAGRMSEHALLETGVVILRADGWKLLGGQTTIVKK